MLESIFGQDYPKSKIEVLVIDDNSSDKTVQIAETYPVTILKNGKGDAEIGKLIAFKKSACELFTYVEGDLIFRNNKWLKYMVRPLVEDFSLSASFTCYYSREEDSSFNKYLTFDPIQRDPLHRFFTPSIEKCIVEKREGYFVCEYSPGNIVPQGLCLYRKTLLLPFYEDKTAYKDRFLELDNLCYLVENGFNKFAYVPKAGYYHEHVKNIFDFLIKRKRNLVKVFLPDEETRKFRWVDLETFRGKLKVILWIFYSESVILPLVVGFIRAIKYSSLLTLYEPIATWLETNVLIVALLKDKKGRVFLSKMINS